MKLLSYVRCGVLLTITTTMVPLTQNEHLGGLWYPKNKKALQTLITNLSHDAHQQYNASVNPSDIKAIIVPHAGYAYSGTVAASVYRLLDAKNITKVIILAPDHSGSFAGVALPLFNAYKTPLGTLPVHTQSIAKIYKKEFFYKKSEVFNKEHSLEIQLPLIQTYLPRASIVPLIVGKLTCGQAREVAQSLQTIIDKNTLVVVSSDFIHYGKRFNFTPFTKYIFPAIRQLDSHALTIIQQGTCADFETFMKETQATICGHYPLKILLSLLESNAFGSVEPRLIAYDTSGSQENGTRNSVSYVGMLFTQEKLATLPIEKQLTQQEQRGLLQEAKDVLHYLFDEKIDTRLLYPIQSFGVMQQHGAFTTLEKEIDGEKKLRGCIGRIATSDPLYKTVATVTRESALKDSRFEPVIQKEVPELFVKLSVLSPLQRVDSYKDIIVGKHGVIVKQQNKSAVFLPEVAPEFGWTRKQMLTQLSKKAGLKPYAWQDKNTQFSIFSTLDIE